MNFESWLEKRYELYKDVETLSEKLNSFPSLENGLVPDGVRNSSEYQNTKKAFDLAFTRLRNFNGNSPKSYKQEAAKLRRGRKLS